MLALLAFWTLPFACVFSDTETFGFQVSLTISKDWRREFDGFHREKLSNFSCGQWWSTWLASDGSGTELQLSEQSFKGQTSSSAHSPNYFNCIKWLLTTVGRGKVSCPVRSGYLLSTSEVSLSNPHSQVIYLRIWQSQLCTCPPGSLHPWSSHMHGGWIVP